MLLAAAGGLVTELISLWLLFGRQKDNLNMKGAIWHVIQTFVGSIIIVTALVIKFTGFYPIDPILSMLFGVVLLWTSWGIIREATRILLQTVPEDFDIKEMVAAIEKMDAVEDVPHAHVWVLTTGKNIVSMPVLVDDTADQKEELEEIHEILKNEFSVFLSTIQVETECPERDEASDIDINTHSEHTHRTG